MNVHRSGRIALQQRAEMVRCIREKTLSVRAAAAVFNVSRPTVYKWVKRYLEEGGKGLEDRTSAPVRRPGQTPRETEDRIKELRESERLSGPRIAARLHLSRSTVGSVLRRLGMGRLPRLKPEEPIVRFEHEAPGDLLHLDVKKLREFDRPGRRYIDEGGKRKRGAKQRFLHVSLDDYSRYAFPLYMPGESARDCIKFLRKAVAHFAELGVVVKRILTDNAPGYRSKAFAKAVRKLGIKHTFTRVRRPQTNGKVERFIRIMIDEWAYARKYQNSRERDALLPAWIYDYNHTRPHGALGYRPPVTRLPGRK